MRFQTVDKKALSAQAQRGFQIFSEKAKCVKSHDGKPLTDQQFHDVGIGMDAEMPDLGRNTQSKADNDRGAFNTPTRLDIGKSGPYFHNWVSGHAGRRGRRDGRWWQAQPVA